MSHARPDDTSPPRPAAFLDRDDTIIDDPGFLDDPAGVVLLPRAAEGMRRLASAGYALVIVTNQSGIARGYFTEAQLHAVHDELRRQLREQGVELDGITYCPYHPTEAVEDRYRVDSPLRKPGPGMLQKAAAELNLTLPDSWMIGDREADIGAGRNAGCRTLLMRAKHHAGDDSGNGSPVGDPSLGWAYRPDAVVSDLMEAADRILGEAC